MLTEDKIATTYFPSVNEAGIIPGGLDCNPPAGKPGTDKHSPNLQLRKYYKRR